MQTKYGGNVDVYAKTKGSSTTAFSVKKSCDFLGRLAQWLASRTTDQGVPGSTPGRGTVCCGPEQVTFTHCLVLV